MILSTYHENVLCKLPCDTSRLASCTQEEADARIFLHLEDIVKKSCDKVTIHTVDTDVVVASQCLSHIQWVACGVGKHVRFLEAHEIATALGLGKCRSLPFFHALGGCYIIYFFHYKGDKTAWDTWKNLDAVTEAFCSLGQHRKKLNHILNLLNNLLYCYMTVQLAIHLWIRHGKSYLLIYLHCSTRNALPVCSGVERDWHWKVGCRQP